MLVVQRRWVSRLDSCGRMLIWWLCKCDCGNKKWIRGNLLTTNPNRGQKSCGCLLHAMGRPRRKPVYKLAERACRECGRTFSPRAGNAKYCSKVCLRNALHAVNNAAKIDYKRRQREQALTNPQDENQWLIKSRNQFWRVRKFLSNPEQHRDILREK
jgi:hypothetical protein